MKSMRKLMKPMRTELFRNIRVNTDVLMELFLEEKEQLMGAMTTIDDGSNNKKKESL